MEALNLAVRAVARPGDVIAIESPTYFAVLQIIESLGMKAIKIPTHPRGGMDLDALSRAIRKHSVRGCISIANCHNPLGYILDDDYKKSLVALLTRHHVPLVEDDIYGDLAFNGRRPKTAKTFDTEGMVLLCSSFSKVLAPGFRVGWIEAGRYRDTVRRLKFINTIASPSLPQLVIAEFIESGGSRRGFTKHKHRPRCDFSASGQFKNYIRISCGHPWSDSIDRAMITLGKLAEKR